MFLHQCMAYLVACINTETARQNLPGMAQLAACTFTETETERQDAPLLSGTVSGICIFTYTVIVILRLRLGVRMYITEKESLAAWPVWQHTFTGVSDTEIERQDIPSLRGKCFCMACLASRNLCRSPRSLSFLISSRWLLYKYGFLEIWKQAQQ